MRKDIRAQTLTHVCVCIYIYTHVLLELKQSHSVNNFRHVRHKKMRTCFIIQGKRFNTYTYVYTCVCVCVRVYVVP